MKCHGNFTDTASIAHFTWSELAKTSNRFVLGSEKQHTDITVGHTPKPCVQK